MKGCPALEMLERAKEWAASESRISAALVYGSVAQGRADEWSDLDLLLVTSGDREVLWAERQQIADRILGDEGCVWAGEVSHQRPYRYGAYRADAAQLDLTMDEGRAKPWHGLADGFVPLLDRDNIVEKLRADFADWKPHEPDAKVSDGPTWVWLKYLAGRLRRGQYWMVRCGLVSLAYERIVPLLGVTPNAVDTALPADLRHRLYGALPVDAEVGELTRALRATTELYVDALEHWSRRTEQARPAHPLAPAVLDRIRRL